MSRICGNFTGHLSIVKGKLSRHKRKAPSRQSMSGSFILRGAVWSHLFCGHSMVSLWNTLQDAVQDLPSKFKEDIPNIMTCRCHWVKSVDIWARGEDLFDHLRWERQGY
ncbi:hypothetical protein N7468_000344 [Penicillium chermesinum]|uniref:Uncharacterized protein n=1 Tax=Penicillium chermesinum TaxID=63820 RepID=A0A9W9PK28_9EURO|nr:uncharacterized protein N7468_000344 [Penicillium chermesinum]KAJ5248893.1 hypothetical protein N7468_000344 [Penicillium chermesinum]